MTIPSTRRIITFFAATLLLVGVEFAVTQSAAFARHPVPLSVAVLFDLTVITSVLFHWLLTRPKGWSWVRAVLVGLLMFRFGA